MTTRTTGAWLSVTAKWACYMILSVTASLAESPTWDRQAILIAIGVGATTTLAFMNQSISRVGSKP